MTEHEQSAANKALLTLSKEVKTRGNQRKNNFDIVGYLDSVRILAMFKKAFNATGRNKDGDFKSHIDPTFKASAEFYLAEKWTDRKAAPKAA